MQRLSKLSAFRSFIRTNTKLQTPTKISSLSPQQAKALKEQESQAIEFRKFEQDSDDKIIKKYHAVTNFASNVFFSVLIKEGVVLNLTDDFQRLNEVLQFKSVAGRFVTLDTTFEKYFDQVSEYLMLHCFDSVYKKMDRDTIRSIYVESLQLGQTIEMQQKLIRFGKANPRLSQHERNQVLRPILNKLQLEILSKREMKALEDLVNYKYQLEQWMYCYGLHDKEITQLTDQYHENIYQWIAGIGTTYSQRRWVYLIGIITLVLVAFGVTIVFYQK